MKTAFYLFFCALSIWMLIVMCGLTVRGMDLEAEARAARVSEHLRQMDPDVLAQVGR